MNIIVNIEADGCVVCRHEDHGQCLIFRESVFNARAYARCPACLEAERKLADLVEAWEGTMGFLGEVFDLVKTKESPMTPIERDALDKQRHLTLALAAVKGEK